MTPFRRYRVGTWQLIQLTCVTATGWPKPLICIWTWRTAGCRVGHYTKDLSIVGTASLTHKNAYGVCSDNIAVLADRFERIASSEDDTSHGIQM